jgi:hypothetical protein
LGKNLKKKIKKWVYQKTKRVIKIDILLYQRAYEMIKALKRYAEDRGNKKLVSRIFSFECEYKLIIQEIHHESKQIKVKNYYSLV